ncbi:rab gtpase activator [Lichtheimia corymbifera JMRC:FSU:9682]|uniref:Rab gtpase activator n=1 Tax=Lichtheimia corymbifera JMRC:FSU:9682 TaxID=1263082 RepID=A0A068RG33_9FUNG|nr:rab gtpase activator [Lichtheimia corymbifera JMRC:FSU:9682]
MSHSPTLAAVDSNDSHLGNTDQECFSLCEYDLDVVDDALNNPTRGEYRDHFGFHIQVKTDDEDEASSSSDDSDSDLSDQEDGIEQQHHHQGTTTNSNNNDNDTNRRPPRRLQPTHSTTTSSEEDDTSVDTAMTTPTMLKHPFPLPTTTAATTDTPRRCRSSTVAESLQEQEEEEDDDKEENEYDNENEEQSLSNTTTMKAPKRRRAATVVRQKPLPPRPLEDEPETTITSSQGSNLARTRSESGKSFHSFSFFKRTDSLSSRSSHSSTTSTSRPLERPSQAFQERQSKRMSGLIRGTQPPAAAASCTSGAAAAAAAVTSPSSSANPKRFSYAGGTTSSYYDMIRSKLGGGGAGHSSNGGGRYSEDQHHSMRESMRHLALKEETKECLNQVTLSDPDKEFWESFIQDTDHVIKSQLDNVRQHMVAGGIPLSVRGHLWQLLSKSRNMCELETEYKELLKRVSPHEKSIRRDLERNFPATAFFQHPVTEGLESIFHVIKAYSLFDQQVGYNKQLFYLVACLVSNMPDENAFSVLVKLMSQYSLRPQYTLQQPELLHERLYQFNHLLQQMLPQVHEHLEKQHVQPSMYASQWFLTFFAFRGPLHLACRVLDVVLIEGAQMMLRFALTLVFRNQEAILELDDFESLIHFLNNTIYDDYKDDVNDFIQDAYHLDIAPKLLARLTKQYANEAARDAKIQSQEEQLRRANAEVTNQLRRLEKSYQSLEKDHHEVASQVIDAKMHVAKMDDENEQLRRQLAQSRGELEKFKMTAPVVDNLMRENAHLKQQNDQLTTRLADLESMLVNLKIKHAETESAYDDVQQKLQACGGGGGVHHPPINQY